MSALTERIVDVALAEVTRGCKESGGPNKGEPFTRYALEGEQELAWCARFVRWCVEHAGGKLPGNRYSIAAVKALRDDFVKAGRLNHAPQLGDVVIYAHRMRSDAGFGMHCGIVVEVTGQRFRSVEGNLGDKVARAEHAITDPSVVGFGRVDG